LKEFNSKFILIFGFIILNCNTYLLDFEGKLNYNKTQKLQIKGIDSETDFYIKMIYYLTGKNIDKNVF
jgi:hypothetical protein